jgi:hypothetical protein
MHQLPTLVHAAVLGPDLVSDADLARLIFGALLWIALVVLNRRAVGASAIPRSPTFTSAPAAQQAGDGSVQGRRERAAVRRD